MDLNVVCFDVPWPADYGGVIDVYYKLVALKEAGWRITLHTFLYGNRKDAPELEKIAEKVYYYQRPRNLMQLLSKTPFIVESRRNSLLIKRLAALPPGAPILFEGLHTCAFLDNPRLADKHKIVRTHNVEHDYYRLLGHASHSLPKKAFFFLEALKLSNYEKVLRHAQGIAAITENDRRHFQIHYPEVPSETVGCFFSEGNPANPTAEELRRIPEEHFILYNGNLAVPENAKAVRYILKNIVPQLDPGIPVVIAGKGPDKGLLEMAAKYPQVRMMADISASLMQALTERATINLMLTFQSTGMKLKLITALGYARGHVLANTPMLNDPRLSPLCERADTPESQVAFIRNAIGTLPSVESLNKRRETLAALFSNKANAKILSSMLTR